MNVKIKRLNERARMPAYATDGSGAFDIYPIPSQVVKKQALSMSMPTVFKTGLAFEIPAGHVMLIFSRSGHGFKNDVRLANCVGVIDSDYRGELMVKLTKDIGAETQAIISNNSAIAQGMIFRVDRINFLEVDELSTTKRGSGGFGSTNAVVKK